MHIINETPKTCQMAATGVDIRVSATIWRWVELKRKTHPLITCTCSIMQRAAEWDLAPETTRTAGWPTAGLRSAGQSCLRSGCQGWLCGGGGSKSSYSFVLDAVHQFTRYVSQLNELVPK